MLSNRRCSSQAMPFSRALTSLLSTYLSGSSLRIATILAFVSGVFVLTTAIARADTGCYTIVNNTSGGIEVGIIYANNVLPLPTDGSATPVTIGIPKGLKSEPQCYNSGAYAEFILDYGMFKTTSKGNVTVGDVTGAVPSGDLIVIDDPTPKPKKPDDPFKGFLTPGMPFVQFNVGTLKAGDCTLSGTKAVLRADGHIRIATTLTSHTFSGDVWHTQLSLQRPNSTEALGNFDSPVFCPNCNRMTVGNTTPVAWVINTTVNLDFFTLPQPPPPTAQQLQEFQNDAQVTIITAKRLGQKFPMVCPSDTAQFQAWSRNNPGNRLCMYAGVICPDQANGSMTEQILVCDALTPAQMGLPVGGQFVNNTITSKWGWPSNEDSRLWEELEVEPKNVKFVFGPNSC